MEEHDVGASRLLILGSVRGLVKEAEEVQRQFDRFAPHAVALPLGERELEEVGQTLRERGDLPSETGEEGAGPKPVRIGPTGLRDEKLDPGSDGSEYEDFGLFVSSTDMVFLRKLARFADVEMPPPSYQEALRLARVRGVPAVAADLDDEAYTDVFTQHVSLLTLIRQGRRMSRVAKKRMPADDPEAFAFAWDRFETKLRGYRLVQRAREEKIAAEIRRLCGKHERVLAIVEVERMAGVIEALHPGPTAATPEPKGAPASRA
jgi:hypothetical protein